MAAPLFGSAGSQLQGSAATMPVDAPAGVQAGHIVVVTAFVDGTTVTVTAMPAGFVQAAGSPQLALNHRLYVMWKRAAGSDPNNSTYDFTLSGSAYRNAQAVRYTGAVASGDPWDVVDAAANTDAGSQGGITPPVAVATDVVDTLLVFAGTNWGGGSWTPPAGYAERRDSGDGVATVADLAQTAAGSSGAVTATSTGSSNGRAAWLGALMSVAPAGGETVALAPAVLTLAAQPTTAVPGPLSVPLVGATLPMVAVPLAPAVAAGTVTLVAAVMPLTAVPVTAQTTAGALTLAPATLTLAGRPTTPVPGPVGVPLAPAVLTLAAVPLGPAPGPIATQLAAAVLVLAAQPVTLLGPVAAGHMRATVRRTTAATPQPGQRPTASGPVRATPTMTGA